MSIVKRQPHKMVKHTQTIRQQKAELFGCVWPYRGLARVNEDDARLAGQIYFQETVSSDGLYMGLIVSYFNFCDVSC